MGRTKELIFNTMIIGIGKFCTQIVSFLLLPLYTTVLSTEEYGMYDLIFTISTLILPIITLLMEESMFRFLIDCKNDKEKSNVITQTITYILFGTLVFSIVYIVISVFGNFKYKLLIYVYILINILIALRNAIARGMSQIKLFSISNFITSVLIIILNLIGILYFKIGFVAILYSNIIAGIVSTFFVFHKLKVYKYFSFNKIDFNLMKDMVKYSIPLVPNSLSWTVINFSDRIILSTFMGVSSNGIYSVAHKFPTIIDSIYGFFYTSWKESASKTIKDDDSEKFYNYIYYYLERFMLAMILGLIACMPFLFTLFIKKDFISAYKYIPVLLIAIYFGNMSGFYGGIFTAYKNTKIMGISTLISAIINVVVNLILIKKIGIWASAISTLGANYFVYEFRRRKIKSYIKMNESINKILLYFVLIIILSAYYLNNIVFNIISILIMLIYCLILNKKLISNILFEIKKIKKRTN